MSFKVAIIVGSNRKDSINRKLANALVKIGGANLDFSFVQIDDLPIYNADLEADRPAVVNRFTGEVASAQAVLIVTPEHNRGLPTVLKNAIDWGSKPADKNVWRNKPAAITGTSPGAIGTALAQANLRHTLGILGAHVMGGEVYISFKPELLDGEHNVTVEATKTFLKGFVNSFAGFVAKLAG